MLWRRWRSRERTIVPQRPALTATALLWQVFVEVYWWCCVHVLYLLTFNLHKYLSFNIYQPLSLPSPFPLVLPPISFPHLYFPFHIPKIVFSSSFVSGFVNGLLVVLSSAKKLKKLSPCHKLWFSNPNNFATHGRIP